MNRNVQGLQISGIRRFSNLVAQVPGAVSLTIGQPDFPTPEHIKDAAKRAIDDNYTTYTANAGLLQLRGAASRFVQLRYGLEYHPESEVIVTIGASEAIDIALRTLLNPGDEVILPGPVYPGYEPLIRLAGGVPVYVDTRSTGFTLTAALIEAVCTDRTKVVIIPTPANPTGVVMSKDNLVEIAEVLCKRDIYAISDEIYSELVFDGEHVSIASCGGMREKTVVINGVSKSHSMTGWRIGFLFAPGRLVDQMVKVHQYNVSCASSISQYAALEALTHGLDDPVQMRETYRRRRDYVMDRLRGMGMQAVRPTGAFYVFPSIAGFGMTSETFALRLLEREKVAVTPGDAFSAYGEGYIRISYATADDQIQKGLDGMERFVKSTNHA